jgi:hypothetical protein
MVGCFSIIPGLRPKTEQLPEAESAAKGQSYPSTCCTFEPLPAYSAHQKGRLSEVQIRDEKLDGIMAEVASTIDKKVKGLDGELRDLSLKMWDLKEIMWEER